MISVFRFILFLLLIPTAALSQVLVGEVVSVADGDTITILDSNRTQHKIRLYGIDTPEKGQAFGNSAKRHTSKLTSRKTAHVVVMDKDRYGRTDHEAKLARGDSRFLSQALADHYEEVWYRNRTGEESKRKVNRIIELIGDQDVRDIDEKMVGGSNPPWRTSYIKYL